jgi:hypothetical protein
LLIITNTVQQTTLWSRLNDLQQSSQQQPTLHKQQPTSSDSCHSAYAAAATSVDIGDADSSSTVHDATPAAGTSSVTDANVSVESTEPMSDAMHALKQLLAYQRSTAKATASAAAVMPSSAVKADTTAATVNMSSSSAAVDDSGLSSDVLHSAELSAVMQDASRLFGRLSRLGIIESDTSAYTSTTASVASPDKTRASKATKQARAILQSPLKNAVTRSSSSYTAAKSAPSPRHNLNASAVLFSVDAGGKPIWVPAAAVPCKSGERFPVRQAAAGGSDGKQQQQQYRGDCEEEELEEKRKQCN